MACNTLAVVSAVSTAFPRAGVIGFTTIVEDEAARAFSIALFAYLADRFTERKDVDAKKAFSVSMSEFERNFAVGDPAAFLDPQARPNSAACKTCQPPVHGIPVLYVAGKEVSLRSLRHG